MVYQILPQAHFKEAHMNRTLTKQHSVESLVAYVFTLHLKACDHLKFNLKFPWYGLQMSFKGPHNVMVTALDP